jgi:hypothetical protein
MRPKFAIALFLIAGIFSGGAIYLKHRLTPAAAPVAPEAVAVAAPEPPQKSAVADLPLLPPPAPGPAPVPALSPEQQLAAMDEEIERLRVAGLSDDPADLEIILTNLNNPEKEIREAAINAAQQFGSTNAIPALLTAATNAVDPKEKIELTEAAEFIALPSLAFNTNAGPQTPEQIQADQQKRSQMQADRQARLQGRQRRSGQNQSAQPAMDPNAVPPDGNQNQ